SKALATREVTALLRSRTSSVRRSFLPSTAAAIPLALQTCSSIMHLLTKLSANNRALLRFLPAVILASLGFAPDLQAAPEFAAPVTQGSVDAGSLRQASGIALSHDNPGVLWTHNDAGDGPRIFALNTQGQLLGTYSLPGADAVDYEDIAIGPGPVPGI